MKKVLTVFLALTMTFLVACSGGTEKHLATAKFNQDLLSIEIKYYGNGDHVSKMEQYIVSDFSSYDDETKKIFESNVQSLKNTYDSIKGVEYTPEFKDNKLHEKIIMNLGNRDTLKKLIDDEILQIENKDANFISLDQTLKIVESQGFTVERH